MLDASRPPASIAEALRWPHVDPVDARVLMQHVLGVSHAYLIAHSERVLTLREQARIGQLLERRQHGEPVAYLVGQREFFGRDFYVDRAVLIPRPETELLVELALTRVADKARPRILDLGTGSGCIALTLALERPEMWVLAVDASIEALAVARRNAAALKAVNVDFRSSDWLAGVTDPAFDLIVANPPYVADSDPHLLQGDVAFEPRAALVAGPRGLDDLATIIAAAGRHLVPEGWLLLEHGWDQADAVAAMLAEAGLQGSFLARDLAGQPRVSGACRVAT